MYYLMVDELGTLDHGSYKLSYWVIELSFDYM